MRPNNYDDSGAEIADLRRQIAEERAAREMAEEARRQEHILHVENVSRMSRCLDAVSDERDRMAEVVEAARRVIHYADRYPELRGIRDALAKLDAKTEDTAR